MANLLVVESWVRAVGLELALALERCGHRYTLMTRHPEHYTSWARQAGLISGPQHPLLEAADRVVTADTNDLEAVQGAARGRHVERAFDGVLTTCDYYLETAASVAEHLGLPGPSPEALAVARHKHWMREACRRAGLPGPAFLAATRVHDALRFAAEIGYPVIAKAVDLCASEQVWAVHNEPELRKAFDSIAGEMRNIRGQQRPGVVLLEEFLRGEEVSVETCSVRGKTTVIGVTDKSLTGYPGFIETGLMHPADLPPETARSLGEFATAALAAVGYGHGLAHTEIKLTASGPRVVEINPRMGGSYLFDLIRLTTGLDPFELLFDLSLDRDPDLVPRRTGISSAALRFLLPPCAGRIRAIDGVEAIAADPAVHRITVDDVVGKEVREPRDNNDFIGHILATDREGRRAREFAEGAARRLVVRMQ
jgi:biotin carboxylase